MRLLHRNIGPETTQADLTEALVFAAAQRHPEIVALLLENGAHPEEALHVLNIIMHHETFSPTQQAIYKTIHSQLMQRMTLVEIILRRASLRDNLISSTKLSQDLRDRFGAGENS